MKFETHIASGEDLVLDITLGEWWVPAVISDAQADRLVADVRAKLGDLVSLWVGKADIRFDLSLAEHVGPFIEAVRNAQKMGVSWCVKKSGA